MRPIYTLVVKGNKFEASRAASERNIPAAFIYETSTDTVLATRADVADVAHWFAEHATIGPNGFPAGTLLIYSEHKGETLQTLKAGLYEGQLWNMKRSARGCPCCGTGRKKLARIRAARERNLCRV